MLIAIVLSRIILRDSTYLDTESGHKISKHDECWYYIFCKEPIDFEQEYGIRLDNIFALGDRFYTIYMSREKAMHISQNRRFWIKKIPSKDKVTSESNSYIVMHSKNCKLPGSISQIGEFISIVNYGGSIISLSKIKCIRKIEAKKFNPTFQTRFHKNAVHRPDDILEISPRSVLSPSSFYHSSLITGTGQCAALIDSGIDANNPWFFDSKIGSRFINNSLKHRKILNLLPLGDSLDDEDGHGTFIAGVVAGKANCRPFGPYYNGLAPDAKLFIVDIHRKKDNNYWWPSNFSDIVEIPSYFGCNIQLHSWTMGNSPLLTVAIDSLAYKNPNVLMIFPADNEGKIVSSPADSKNVLTVGSTTGQYSSFSATNTSMPTAVYVGQAKPKLFIGYTDPSGTPLVRVGNFESDPLLGRVNIDNKDECVCIYGDDFLSKNPNCAALLVFHNETISNQYSYPVIRMPNSSYEFIAEEENVYIGPSPNAYFDKNRPNMYIDQSSYGTNQYFKIKPEIVAPGGPMIGPKAGSTKCSPESLTIKEGTSVSAAIVASQALLISQFLSSDKYYSPIVPKGSLLKALIINSAEDYTLKDELPSERYGWGTPILSSIMPLSGRFSGNQTSFLYVQQDIEITEGESLYYCFKADKKGLVRATISWLDLPRDPLASTDVSSIVSIRISDNEKNSITVIGNHRKSDIPVIDVFNTAVKAEKFVNAESEVMISIVAGHFALNQPIKIALAITGPFSILQSKSNLTCTAPPQHPPCARECISRGICIKGFCSCSSGRAGDFCGTKIEKVSPNNPSRMTLKRYEWKMFRFCPSEWKEGYCIKIPLSGLNKSRIGLHINIDQTPSWDRAQCTLVDCPEGNITDTELILPYNNWHHVNKGKCLIFGIFVHTGDSYDIDFGFSFQ